MEIESNLKSIRAGHGGFPLKAIGLLCLLLPIALFEDVFAENLVEGVADSAKESISIASQNLNRFFDDKDDPQKTDKVLTSEVYQKNLQKISNHFQKAFNCPDIILVQEIENISVLKDLALKTCSEIKSYQAILKEGFDPGGIDVGALVSDHIRLISWYQIGADQYFEDTRHPLYTRPPLFIQFSMARDSSKPVNLVVVHLRSMRGLGGKKHQRIVSKRNQQAAWLGKWVENFLEQNENANLIIAGDFNATGGCVNEHDLMAVICNLSNEDLSQRLINLNHRVSENQRYTYLYGG